jgi:oligopeptide transport system permease protein
MLRYVVKRVILAALTVFIVATITFFLMNLVPGGPFVAEKSISAQAQAALKEKFGLDQPLMVQYKNYLASIIQGDFGLSLKQRGRTVSEIIIDRFPVSARLGGISMAVALIVWIPLGSVAALNRGRWIDKAIIVFATCGAAFPSFIICTVGMYVFGVWLKWLPTMGLAAPINYILPVFSLSFYPTAYITRLMRSSMLDVVGQDYMRTARAKGLSQFNCLFRQALRNAILPVITYAGPMLAYLLAGTFVVEKIFVIPGLGGQFVSSILQRDYTVIMGTTIFLAALIIALNALVDIAYKLVDPRIQLQ